MMSTQVVVILFKAFNPRKVQPFLAIFNITDRIYGDLCSNIQQQMVSLMKSSCGLMRS